MPDPRTRTLGTLTDTDVKERRDGDGQMTAEEWRPVCGRESLYEVSSLGRVRILDRIDAVGARRPAKLLKAHFLGTHLAVVLHSGGPRRDAYVHHLVLEAFVGPRPDGMEGCHWNDDPNDNRLENLRWDTRSANQLDSVRNGTHYMARRTHCNKGHEFTPENTYYYPSGRGRACIACRKASRAARPEDDRARVRVDPGDQAES